MLEEDIISPEQILALQECRAFFLDIFETVYESDSAYLMENLEKLLKGEKVEDIDLKKLSKALSRPGVMALVSSLKVPQQIEALWWFSSLVVLLQKELTTRKIFSLFHPEFVLADPYGPYKEYMKQFGIEIDEAFADFSQKDHPISTHYKKGESAEQMQIVPPQWSMIVTGPNGVNLFVKEGLLLRTSSNIVYNILPTGIIRKTETNAHFWTFNEKQLRKIDVWIKKKKSKKSYILRGSKDS